MATTTVISVMHFLEFQSIMRGSIGGSENHLLTLCEHIDCSQVKSAIACFPPKDGSELVRRTTALGVPIYPFPTSGRDALGVARRTFWLARLLRRERVDVLHIHSGGLRHPVAFIAGYLARVPAIVVTHHSWYGVGPRSTAGNVSLWLEKNLAQRAIAVYEGQGCDLASLGIPPERIRVVPYGIDLTRFRCAGGAHDGSSTFRLVIAARLVEGKGHEQLVEAISRLSLRYPNLRLSIAGDGPARGRIEAQVQACGLGQVVEFVGWVPNADLPELLQNAQATVLPTYWPGEAFPITLLESMAMGLPAIASRWAGIPEMIVDGQSGFIVEPRDVEGLVAALDRMLATPGLAARMGQRARKRVEDLYTAERMAQTVVTTYQELSGVIRPRH